MATFSRESRIGFIGAGRVGGSLAVAFSRQGYPVAAVASRTFSSAQALAERVPGCVAYETIQEVADQVEVVFITTADDAIDADCCDGGQDKQDQASKRYCKPYDDGTCDKVRRAERLWQVVHDGPKCFLPCRNRLPGSP